jgi:cAMP-dependent protein kinase regulator
MIRTYICIHKHIYLHICIYIYIYLVTVQPGEELIVQGQRGDYFYIIETGNFNVYVDKRYVSTLEAGRCFGELALIYNTPRNATIRAMELSVVYALDRDTFRNTLANSANTKSNSITQALKRVPLLSSLTDDQLAKISGECLDAYI